MSTKAEFNDARIQELLHQYLPLCDRVAGMLELLEDAGDELPQRR